MTLRLDDTLALVASSDGNVGRQAWRTRADAGATAGTDPAERADLPEAKSNRRHDVTSASDWARSQ